MTLETVLLKGRCDITAKKLEACSHPGGVIRGYRLLVDRCGVAASDKDQERGPDWYTVT